MTRPPDFVVFSDDWGRHPSSCQHLFRRIRRDHRVLWVNTIGLRAAKADSFTFLRGLEKLREWSRPLRRVDKNMWVLAPIMLPVSGAGALGRLNRWQAARAVRRTLARLGMRDPVLFASVPTAIDYVGRLGESAVVYYITDDYSLWPGGNAEQIRRADRDLAAAADLILPCNEVLAGLHADCGAMVEVLPHAVDAEHFAAEGSPAPDDLPSADGPRLCFFGLVYEKIDLPLLAQLARRRRDLQILMIGPVKTDTSPADGIENLHFLGPRDYAHLPAYLQAMDVLVVPYVRDEETLRKGPLKIRECLAAGKPTVARRIPDLEQYEDLVVLYDGPEQFGAAVDKALAQRGDAELERQMRARIAAETWQARVEQIEKCIPRILNRPEGAP
jgi:glycosyltransferase involved in cell wall biosynthesis